MSFDPNDMKQSIHRGNYEEFFVLYMDGELDEVQMAQVEAFLAEHPDLREELDLLMATKLTDEDVILFNKEDLMAGKMKITVAEDDLLLYIDNELPSQKQPSLLSELAKNKELEARHQLLLRTKLDPNEQIPYPNKEELYRSTRRVAAIRPWMRVAAAAVVIAAFGWLYMANDSQQKDQPLVVAKAPAQQPKTPSVPVTQPAEQQAMPQEMMVEKQPSEQVAFASDVKPAKKQAPRISDDRRVRTESDPLQTKDLRINMPKEDVAYDVPPTYRQQESVDAYAVHPVMTEPVNNSFVTSSPSDRNTSIQATAASLVPGGGEVAKSKKGSVKGLLRKATRLVERTTGFDPTNENNEIMIAAVSLKLK
jgi:hypothetical protein